MEYQQNITTNIINQLRTAGRKTSVSYLANAIHAGHERLAELDSLVIRLLEENEALRADNENMSKMLDEAQKPRRSPFNYNELIHRFYLSGKSAMRKRMTVCTSEKGVWYVPTAAGVRHAAERLGLPVDAQQRTGGKDSDNPVIVLYRTDVEDEDDV